MRATRRPDRKGKRVIAGHVDEQIYRQFKIVAAEDLLTTDSLVHEALDLLFESRRNPERLARRLLRLGQERAAT